MSMKRQANSSQNSLWWRKAKQTMKKKPSQWSQMQRNYEEVTRTVFLAQIISVNNLNLVNVDNVHIMIWISAISECFVNGKFKHQQCIKYLFSPLVLLNYVISFRNTNTPNFIESWNCELASSFEYIISICM